MALRITGLGEEIASVTGLPWHLPLEEWPEDPVLAEKRGISRHVVRLVRASSDPDAVVYAVKETVSEFANREYVILRQLSQLGAPCVAQVPLSRAAQMHRVKNFPAQLLPGSCRTHCHIEFCCRVQ